MTDQDTAAAAEMPEATESVDTLAKNSADIQEPQVQQEPQEEEAAVAPRFLRQDPKAGRSYYAIHTYSGHEKAVQRALEQRRETFGLEEKLFSVVVPEETEIVLRAGKPVQRQKCLFPGYVLVEMIVDDESWYVVRNTPGVTGFVGSGTVPIPVTPEEFGIVQRRMGTDTPQFSSEFSKGDVVRIVDGPFVTHEGVVDKVHPEKGRLSVLVTLFERETPMELEFAQVQKK